MTMPDLEYQLWSEHFADYPPGDYLAQSLLAHLCVMLSSIFRKEGSEPPAIADFAPWFSQPLSKAEKEKQARNAILSLSLSTVKDSRAR